MMMGDKKPAETPEELQERSETIKHKLENRKLHKKSNKAGGTKSERKKQKLEKLKKKQLKKAKVDAVKNEILKQERGMNGVKNEQVKEDPGGQKNGKPVYNKEGKLFFSKVTIDGEKKKKGKEILIHIFWKIILCSSLIFRTGSKSQEAASKVEIREE